ncbi:MAG: hypothetical protein SP1CHLAM54_16470 [Chlamydiia bacterium]|nr:hypothetical protein [Chlamydiia bacterium]MCH9616536.1 hypothetical protein [Chlamydiia bacterium]MCH9629266.1 hypothetical protein [Chlamydiia bacterium]
MKIAIFATLFCMKKLLASLMISASLFGESVVANNRPLAVANNRLISVMDVQKKMDLFLFEHDVTVNSERERYQFYMGNWRYTLDQMIDAEYMMLRAEKREMVVGEGDIREEMMSRYGPNILATLEKLDISYDEAWDMLKKDLSVQRVLWQGVQAKVMQKVTPQAIKHAYYAYLLSHPPKEEWEYQFVTLRGDTKDALETVGETALSLLSSAKATLDDLPTTLTDTTCSISVSKPMTVDVKDMSEKHKTILSALKEGEYSTPISEVSRASGEPVTRVFKLNKIAKESAPVFNDMHDKLKSSMLQQQADEENKVYSKKMREEFGFIETPIPENFQPFSVIDV